MTQRSLTLTCYLHIGSPEDREVRVPPLSKPDMFLPEVRWPVDL